MKEEISEDSLKSFLDQYINKTLEPYYRSEPIPTKTSNIKQLVGSTVEINTQNKEYLSIVLNIKENCEVCNEIIIKFNYL